MSRMTEYIAIEDDNVMSHFLQVLQIWEKRNYQTMQCWGYRDCHNSLQVIIYILAI